MLLLSSEELFTEATLSRLPVGAGAAGALKPNPNREDCAEGFAGFKVLALFPTPRELLEEEVEDGRLELMGNVGRDEEELRLMFAAM